MENKGNTMLKSSMTYGLILGIALVVFSLITYIMGVVKPPAWVSVINIVIMIGGVFYGIKKYRDEDLGGEITYGKAVGYGILICVFAAVISSIYTLLLVTVIDTEYINKILAMQEEEMVNKGIYTDEQIDLGMQYARKFTSPVILTISGLFSGAFFGTIVSLILAIFLKKEKPLFDKPADQN